MTDPEEKEEEVKEEEAKEEETKDIPTSGDEDKLYCKQCSVKLFGENRKQLAGLIKPGEDDAVLEDAECANCKGKVVTHSGRCVDKNCEAHKNRV